MTIAAAADLAALVERQRAFFASGAPRSEAFRRQALVRLRAALVEREPVLFEALARDLHKPAFEAYATEIGLVVHEIDHTLAHLRRWMRPRRRPTPLFLLPARSQVRREPLGCALIVAPWNFPVQLLLMPLVGAVAAGCCAIVKPSARVPATSAALAALLRGTFSEAHVAVVEGGGTAVVPALLEHRFDLVFFTGSPTVGREVAARAARHLSPVVLELGGKSPCLVDETADLARAAERIAWGKFVNAGQTCVAPDYVLVAEGVKEALVERLKGVLQRFYGADPRRAEYARIVDRRRWATLRSYLSQGRIRHGGEVDEEQLYVAPTIMDEVSLDAPVMREEIFGPILPVLPYGNVEQALAVVAERPQPLALYVFSRDRALCERILDSVRSGGACINHTLVQLTNPDLPFGGVGESGIGCYHGERSFLAFTHEKGVVTSPTWFETGLTFPPYAGKLRWARALLRRWPW